VLDGFGRSVRAACLHAAPRTTDELAELLDRARREGLSVAFRGAGRSYGDASLNRDGLVVDLTRLARALEWSPETGTIDAEAGLTIEGLWRRTIEDGHWPAVVPGTMRPTLGGCLSTNVHGKNNYRVGSFGEHVVDFDLATPALGVLRCSRQENADLFHAAIGGLGLLGAITRVRLRLRRVESGLLRVRSMTAPCFEAAMDRFESELAGADYLVGWIDGLARGASLGRGVLHSACYLPADEDPSGGASLHVEAQGLPARIGLVPRAALWRLMRPLMNDVGIRLLNALKYAAARRHDEAVYLQSHAAFAFLLDYVPDWRLAYGREGFIQFQIFVPEDSARAAIGDSLAMAQRCRLPPYLAVLKRHRPDPFLLSHGIDGWSLAMDFRVRSDERGRLDALTGALTERVLAAGGTFYMAKDAVIGPRDLDRAYGRARLDRFRALRTRVDPDAALASDLDRRLLSPPSRAGRCGLGISGGP
jgi:FAD/FMN-containing dehydrogenase